MGDEENVQVEETETEEVKTDEAAEGEEVKAVDDTAPLTGEEAATVPTDESES